MVYTNPRERLSKIPRWHQWDAAANKKGPHATVYTIEGDEYLGEWLENRRHGKGTYKDKRSGSIYEGEWVNDRRCGYGTLSVPVDSAGASKKDEKNKSPSSFVIKKQAVLEEAPRLRKLYAGGWVDDQRHGYGTCFYENSSSYQGEWEKDVRSGWGTMFYSDGSRYDGEWHDDKRHGQGILHLANGDRYEGMWFQDKKEGPGKFLYKKRRQVYEGEWAADQPRCGTIQDIPEIPGASSPTISSKKIMIPKLTLENPSQILSEGREIIAEDRLRRLFGGAMPVSAANDSA